MTRPSLLVATEPPKRAPVVTSAVGKKHWPDNRRRKAGGFEERDGHTALAAACVARRTDFVDARRIEVKLQHTRLATDVPAPSTRRHEGRCDGLIRWTIRVCLVGADDDLKALAGGGKEVVAARGENHADRPPQRLRDGLDMGDGRPVGDRASRAHVEVQM